ncbi:MAG: hypothetical protein Kow0099_24710 [Candidatus Abyssubacteria bacterium]
MNDESSNKQPEHLEQRLECTNCGGLETIVLEEEMKAQGDKVYPSGSVLCAKCRTPTMVLVYRWNKWKQDGG